MRLEKLPHRISFLHTSKKKWFKLHHNETPLFGLVQNVFLWRIGEEKLNFLSDNPKAVSIRTLTMTAMLCHLRFYTVHTG